MSVLRASRLTATALGVLLAAAVFAAEGDRPPVPIRQTTVLTPPEAAGTGVAPEVQLRVHLDARGRVSEVEVLEIEPASDFDEFFRQAVVEAISQWRYAPAIENGEETGATLEWTVQFRSRDNDDTPWAESGADLASRRARILAMPVERRKRLLAAQASFAERHLAREHRKREESPRFVVVTDAQDETTTRILANSFETVFRLLDKLFRPLIDPQPEPYKIVAYVYTNQGSFQGLRSELGAGEFAAGLYSASGLLAFHREVPTYEMLMGVLMHEATHAYVDRYLLRPGRTLPRWLGEGFANYVGNSRIGRKGRILLGDSLKSKYVLSPGYSGVFRLKTEAGWDIGAVKRALRAGEGLSIRELMDADLATFYGERARLFYPTSWFFVHFLRHGEDTWAEQEFPIFVLYAAEGYPIEEALEQVYGLPLDELEERFLDYVKEF